MADLTGNEATVKPDVPTQADVDAGKTVVHNTTALVAPLLKETKAGWRTTEFWVSIITLLIVNLNGVILTLPDKYQAIATGAIAGFYAISRGVAKSGIPAVDAPVAPLD